jgi:CBS domain-containing protein
MVSRDDLIAKALRPHLDRPLGSVLERPEPMFANTATYGELVNAFVRPEVDIAFIVDSLAEQKLQAIVTRTDLIELQRSRQSFAADSPITVAAKTKVVVLGPSSTVRDAVKVFTGRNPLSRPVSKIPIVDGDRKLVGYVEENRLTTRLAPVVKSL